MRGTENSVYQAARSAQTISQPCRGLSVVDWSLLIPASRTTHHVSRTTFHAPPTTHHVPRSPAFTLVELLLVMAVLAMVLSIAAPSLAGFFRGRSLDSEARRLLALTHAGQTRAVTEGVPMLLWLDAQQRTYGLEEEPGWVTKDPKAEQFSLDADLHMETIASTTNRMTASLAARANRTLQPEIRFLTDGSVDDTSPQAVRLFDRDNHSLWLSLSANHMRYEIRSQPE